MPAEHAIAFLKFHVHPLRATAFGPVIKIMESMFEIKSRPHFIGGALTPLDPVFEGKIGRVFYALRRLQRRSDNAAAAARNGGRSTARISLLSDPCLTPGAGAPAGR